MLTMTLCAVLALGSLAAEPDPLPGSPPPVPDDHWHPFSKFGKDIPGYKDPTTKVKKKTGPKGAASPDVHPPSAPVAQSRDVAMPGADGGAALTSDGQPIPSDKPEEVLTDADTKPVDEDGHPVDLEREDAQSNFHTVIEAFIAANKTGDCWPVREAESRLCLTYLSADSVHLKKRAAGVYSGVVVLKDRVKDGTVASVFTVDFSHDEWSVLDVRLLGRKHDAYRRGPAAAKTRKAPAAVTGDDAKP